MYTCIQNLLETMYVQKHFRRRDAGARTSTRSRANVCLVAPNSSSPLICNPDGQPLTPPGSPPPPPTPETRPASIRLGGCVQGGAFRGVRSGGCVQGLGFGVSGAAPLPTHTHLLTRPAFFRQKDWGFGVWGLVFEGWGLGFGGKS